MLVIIQAYKDGKEIEFRSVNAFTNTNSPWMDCTIPVWDFVRNAYRIKPREPRKLWLLKFPCGTEFMHKEEREVKKVLSYAADEFKPFVTEYIEVMKDG